MIKELMKYLPLIYKDFKEPKTLMEALQPNIYGIVDEYQLAFDRQTVKTADERGVYMYEQLLNIYADESESLEFRRQRIVERLSHQPPFSFRYLIRKLDSIIGKGKYECKVDFNKRELYLKSVFTNVEWYVEVSYLIRRIKPANMVFVYAASTVENVKVSEEVGIKYANWNYKLGYWRLGQLPFYSEEADFKTVKGGANMSVTNALLKNSANCARLKITKVVFNRSIVVNSSEFENNRIVGNNLVFVARVKAPTENITHYAVYADDQIYTEADVFVPKGEETQFEFNIRFKEGE